MLLRPSSHIESLLITRSPFAREQSHSSLLCARSQAVAGRSLVDHMPAAGPVLRVSRRAVCWPDRPRRRTAPIQVVTFVDVEVAGPGHLGPSGGTGVPIRCEPRGSTRDAPNRERRRRSPCPGGNRGDRSQTRAHGPRCRLPLICRHGPLVHAWCMWVLMVPGFLLGSTTED